MLYYDYGNKEILAQNITRMLERRSMTCADLASKINVSRSTVWCWVHAKAYPRIDQIERVAMVFNCQKTDLIERPKDYVRAYSLSEKEYLVVELYRSADPVTKDMIDRLLKYSEAERKLNNEYFTNEQESLQNPGNDERED